MSEKRFKQIGTICALAILTATFLHGKWESDAVNALLLLLAGLGTAGFVYCGFKKDRILDVLENEAAEGIDKVLERYRELIAASMRQASRLSEAEERIRLLTSEVETFLNQTGHNKCWTNEFRLRQVFKISKSRWPDPQKVTLPEMFWGCKVYCPEHCEPLSEKDKQMIKEIEEVIKKYMY